MFNILDIFNKKNLFSYNRDSFVLNTPSYRCFNYLYEDINVNDFAILARENYLNKDYENNVYIDYDYNMIYDIINDSIIRNLTGVNCINLASGGGKIIFLMSMIYPFVKFVGVENMFELYELSRKILKKFRESEFSNTIKYKDISFFNKSLLSAKLEDKNLIILDYNNTNDIFNGMMENKIIREVKADATIIKLLTPFKKNVSLKLLKIKTLLDIKNNKVLVYYYKKTN
ncbi:MAG: hypothetical protein IJ853_02810 [Rickettsiales bacterium]|nr:hypothetical protein [Rickettsiales bacterium]